MNIRIANHEITQSLGIGIYDIAKVSITKSGKTKGKESIRPVAYGVKMERCFTIIMDSLLEEELKDKKLTYSEFLESYKKLSDKLIKESQRLEASLKVVKSSK